MQSQSYQNGMRGRGGVVLSSSWASLKEEISDASVQSITPSTRLLNQRSGRMIWPLVMTAMGHGFPLAER